MNVLALIIIFSTLAAIFWQDYKQRAVDWYLFPLLLLALFYYKTASSDIESLLQQAGINSMFLLVQLAMITAYFSAKHRKWVNITSAYLGAGDIFFLLAITPLFTPFSFMAFYLTSLLLIVAGVLCCRLIKDFRQTIPLAGLQALLLMPVLLSDKYFMTINDQYIINLLAA